MKLPETKKEHNQTIALIIICIIFIVYVTGNYAITPAIKKRKDQFNRIEELKTNIEMAENIIKLTKSSMQLNHDVVAEIVQLTETNNYVLKARLGNYLIGAAELLEKSAREEKITLDSIKGLNSIDIVTVKPSNNSFRLYSVKVQLTCGIHDLIRLLKNIETSNPYLSISEITIKGKPSTPGKHAVEFNVQWPIWRDSEIIAEIIKSSKSH